MDNTLCISSLNVRGLKYAPKRLSVFQWLKDQNIDIACLQETYCTQSFEGKFSKLWDGQIYHSLSKSNHARGVCVMIRKQFQCNIINVIKDDDGRKLMVNIEIDNKQYSVINIYCPNNIKDRIDFLTDTMDWIDEFKCSDDIIMCGDVNCVTDDLDRVTKLVDKSADALIKLKDTLKVSDIWRKLHPQVRDYTFIDPSQRHSDSRIDVIMISDNLANYAQLSEHKYAPVPDHKAVVTQLCTSPNTRGKGYWKLNVSVLSDDEYVSGIRDIIKKTMTDYKCVTYIGGVWELIKIRIKEYSIFYSQRKAKDKSNEIKNLEKEINDLNRKIDIDKTNSTKLYAERSLLKNNLDILYYKNAVGAQIRSRSKWVEEGERSTSYFLNLEKYHQTKNCIHALRENGITYNKDSDILSITENFYTEVFNSKHVPEDNVNEFLSTINMQNLSDNDKLLCDAPLSEKECWNAMKAMKKNKAPGDDGLPIEFYVKFWEDIKVILMKVYKESYLKGSLPTSLRQSVISLIFKKGDAMNITNYRPISLTNTDYRILAFILASRLQNVVDHIIDSNQVAYVKGRYIGSNIRLVLDIIEQYKNQDDEGLLVFLDFTKAFDSVEWNFLFEVLKRFGFGETFVQWIRVLYKDPSAVVKNNGHLSSQINISRGVRQGCPVSALLFIICMEVLALCINQNDDIKGLNLTPKGGNRIKMCQYADDSTLFLKNEKELKLALDLLNRFGQVAGTKLNLSKCEGLWLGRSGNKQENCDLGNIKWPTNPIRYLGIYIGQNDDECMKRNWKDKIDKLDSTLKQWKTRDLTLFGKICIIKSLALSKVVYSAALLCIPDNAVKEINCKIFRYLWGNRDRIKRKIATLSIEQGGLNMIDVKVHFESLKATWINRILNAKDSDKWAVIPKYKLSKLCYNQENIIYYTSFINLRQFPQIIRLPKFYQEVICSYNKTKSISKEHFCNDILDQPLWGNQYVTFEGKTLWFKNWIESGILTLRDVAIRNGKLDTQIISNRIINKSDIFREVHILRIALKPYEIPESINGENRLLPIYVHKDVPFYQLINKKSNFFYQNMMSNNDTRPSCLDFWNVNSPILITIPVLQRICYKKVKVIKDFKLAETNFKIIHNILPCNLNLYRWKLKPNSQCSICGDTETVIHLLYECTYAQTIWKYVENTLGFKNTLANVLFGLDLADDFNYVISIVCYCIYKEWLICSFEQKERRMVPSLKHFKTDLLFRKQVYENLHKTKFDIVCVHLENLLANV